MREHLKNRILRYFKEHSTDWICGGEIQKAAASIGYEPQNAGRRLRELVESGDLNVEYRKSKKGARVAWYKLSEKYKQVSYVVPSLAKQVTLFEITP